MLLMISKVTARQKMIFRNPLIKTVSFRHIRACLDSLGRFQLSSDATSDERLSRYDFWKEKYKTQKSPTFDWFVDSSLLLQNINVHLEELNTDKSHKQLKYLELGCGTSELPLSIYSQNTFPVYVCAMDYVKEAVHRQSMIARDIRPENLGSRFQSVCGDVMNLPFKSESFDVAVDKGTMDALLKNRQQGHLNSCLMYAQAIKCLRKGGRFIHISDEDPDTRLAYLESISQFCNDNDLLQASGHQDVTTMNQSRTHDKDNCVNKINLKSEKCTNNANQPCNYNNQNSLCSFWTFKIIMDEQWNKEYFLYWTVKS